VAPFVAADVGVDAVDVPEFAQRNLASYLAGQSETSAWLGFERDTCLLTAHAGGELAFARRMLLPGAVSHALDADLPAVSEHVSDRVVTQVQRTLEQFERQSGLPSVAQVTVGPYLHARAIAHLLAERAALRTQVFDPAAVFEHAPGVDLVSYPLALTALGGALRMESEADSSSAGWLARLFARQPQPAPVAQTA
jgi:MSHA biogenesis protein MshI